MKKLSLFAALLIIFSVLLCSCKGNGGDFSQSTSDLQSSQPSQQPESEASGESPSEASSTNGETSSTGETIISSPVISENIKGCFYGERTSTDKTYTGLEPIPETDFPDTVFTNDKGLPVKTIEHGYGVAVNEVPHEISKTNQRFFDEKGFNALALDNKTQEKVLYLTFDCGYENGYTTKILDVLRDKNVKAAFFCTLPEMKENPEIIARMITEGHIVGNHSVTHPDFSSLSRREMYDELKGFDDYIREHFGYSSMYFRYPQGKYSENSLDMINSMGFKCVFWSLAYADWDLENQKGAQYALDTVMSRIHPGAVMLLHSVSPDNANALGSIIDNARAKGYEFKLISQAQ